MRASEKEHPDLFWALRGGGGNFGVVTEFEFRLHPVGNVVAGPTLWPLERAREVLSWYREFILAAPRSSTGSSPFSEVPPGPPFPKELHGQKMCAVVWCFSGPSSREREVFAPIREMSPFCSPYEEMPLPTLQRAFDSLYRPGLEWYWRADFIREIPDPAVDAYLEHAALLPTMLSTVHLYPMDGAVHDVGETETAFGHRDARWNEVIVGVDPDHRIASASSVGRVNFGTQFTPMHWAVPT